MASPTKPGPATAAHKSLPRPATAAPPGPDEEMRRLLREAAWTRMFGKAGARNPFARRSR